MPKAGSQARFPKVPRKRFSSKSSQRFPRKCFQARFPRTGFQARLPRKGSQARSPSKVPNPGFQARFPSKVGPNRVSKNRFPGTGSQARLPSKGSQAKLPDLQARCPGTGVQVKFCCYLGLFQTVLKCHSDQYLWTFSCSCCCWGYSLFFFLGNYMVPSKIQLISPKPQFNIMLPVLC